MSPAETISWPANWLMVWYVTRVLLLGRTKEWKVGWGSRPDKELHINTYIGESQVHLYWSRIWSEQKSKLLLFIWHMTLPFPPIDLNCKQQSADLIEVYSLAGPVPSLCLKFFVCSQARFFHFIFPLIFSTPLFTLCVVAFCPCFHGRWAQITRVNDAHFISFFRPSIKLYLHLASYVIWPGWDH